MLFRSGLKREADGRRVPAIVFTKGGGLWLEDIAATGCDAVGLDWTIELSAARARIGGQVALQGNLDPAVLFAQPEAIRAEAGKVLASFGAHSGASGGGKHGSGQHSGSEPPAGGSGHVFNLGHGISQFTPPEHAAALVAAVHELSPQYHR